MKTRTSGPLILILCLIFFLPPHDAPGFGQTSEAVREIDVLVLLIHYSNTDSLPGLKSLIQEKYFNGSGAVNGYFHKVSGGAAELRGHVMGWYRVNRPSESGFLEKDEIRDILEKHHIDTSPYGYISAINNRQNFLEAMGWSNRLAYQGEDYALSICNINTDSYCIFDPGVISNLDNTFIHEMGHNMRLSHAASWVAQNGRMTFIERGNFLDLMGSGFSGHFNSFSKERLGWQQEPIVIDRPGIYELKNYRHPVSGNYAKLIYDSANGRAIHIEYRDFMELDSMIAKAYVMLPSGEYYSLANEANGLFLISELDYLSHYKPSPVAIPLYPANCLLDPTPDDANPYNAAVKDGVVYTDSAYGFSVGPVISTSDSSIRFEMNFFPNPVPRAVLESPADKDEVGHTNISLAWDNLGEEVQYDLEIASDSHFMEIVLRREAQDHPRFLSSGSDFSCSPQDIVGHRFYWRVRCRQGQRPGPWSAPRCFDVVYGSTVFQTAEPETFLMHGNYPNPFNAMTTLRYTLPRPGRVRITLLDALGRTVSTLKNAMEKAGDHTLLFDAAQLPSGIYICRMTFQGRSALLKMICLK